MKTTFYNGLFILLLLVPFISCEKAGTGGKAQINITVQNNGSLVPFALVKVRYGANAFPGSNANYNNEIEADHTGLAVFENLRKGDYYFYATAPDSLGTGILEGGEYFKIQNRIGETHVVIDLAEDP